MNDIVRKVIEAAIKAPSGENAQPWKFVVRGNAIEIYLDQARDLSPYSWGHRSSYVAIGAALENLSIASTAFSHRAEIELFPNILNAPVAKVVLIPGSIGESSLIDSLSRRVTNRKKYKKDPLSSHDKAVLQNVELPKGSRLYLTDDKKEIEVLVRAGTNNERIMLSNQVLHNYFFSHVNWTLQDDEARKIGFYVKTLELPSAAVLGFKAMRSWGRAQFMNRYLKMNSLVADQNAALYAASPTIGVISMDTETPESAVYAGRALEHLWLTATANGMSLQPIAGILYLNLAVSHGDSSIFSAEEQKLIHDSYEQIQAISRVNKGYVYFMFRIGFANTPSAQARRFSVESVTEEID